MIVAKLRIKVSSRPVAKSLMRAVSPDNLNMQGLTVRSEITSGAASFNIRFAGKIETFISTLDDLLRCLQAAKDTIDRIAAE